MHLRSNLPGLALALALACARPPVPPPDAGEPSPTSPQPEGWDEPLRLSTLEDLDPAADTVHVALTARVASVEVVPGKPTPLWTYGGSLPGPLIRAKKGDTLVVSFQNELPEATTIHWHGLRVPAEMDGTEAAQKPIQPGASFEYRFQLLDSGTYWYHPHVRSSAQVGYGLYGMLVVEDSAEPPLGDALPLVLSDLSVDAEGKLAPGDESGWFGDYFGREGATLLVNGRVRPVLKARVGAPQRWRVVNASRARYFRFSVEGQQLILLGTDGGLISAAQAIPQLTLAPGERAELFLRPKPQAQGPVTVNWEDPNRFHLPQGRNPEPLFTFEVTDDPPYAGPALPTVLRTLPPATVDGPTQSFELMEKAGAPGAGAVLGINGKTFAESAGSPVHARVGTTELWEVTNSTLYDHPFHLHGFFFEVLSVDGKPPAYRSLKDTLNVLPKQRLQLAVHFDDRPGMWMFHCHILDHADLGMMAMLMVMR